MKPVFLFLLTVSLAACSVPPGKAAQTASETHPVSAASATPTPATASYKQEEAEVRALVENFGQRLQTVSLLGPDAAQEIQQQYSEFVSGPLLARWMSDVSQAPGRAVSSPWPDRIEIASLSREGTGSYVILGAVIEVTSTEITAGGEAAKVPVRIVVQQEEGRWVITGYAEER